MVKKRQHYHCESDSPKQVAKILIDCYAPFHFARNDRSVQSLHFVTARNEAVSLLELLRLLHSRTHSQWHKCTVVVRDDSLEVI